MFFFDPIYLLFLAPGLLLSLWASAKTKSAFNKWGKVRARMTGAQAARSMLDRAGLYDVKIGQAQGFLSDHYNPATRSLALSPKVYGEASISAVGVACHEAGHALQHAQGMIQLGILLFSATVVFQLVTLPVEFDASNRAKELVVNYGILGPSERIGVDKVLNAAAWTYVAAAVTSILTLLYFLFRAGLLGGSDD